MPTTSCTILEPRLVSCHAPIRPNTSDNENWLECSVHSLPKPLQREFRHVFGEKYLLQPVQDQQQYDQQEVEEPHLEVIAIPTNQQAKENLVAVGDEIEQEKDRLLNVVRSPRKENW